MKFKIEEPLTEKDYGRKRYKKKFLWFPKKLDYEVRWLERAMIEQVVDYSLSTHPNEIHMDYRMPLVRNYYWKDLHWAND